jgi:hypothetical protein
MQIAPIAKTSEASDSTCTQSIPAMAEASAKFRLSWVIRADRPSVDFQERVSSGRPAGVIHKLIVVPTFEHV